MAKTETPIAPREAPTIPVASVSVQDQGTHWKTVRIKPLPKDFTLADFNEAANTIWKSIQGNVHVALREDDRIVAFAHDRSWMVEAIVSHAEHDRVTLAGIRKTDLQARDVALWANEDFKIEWAGSGYGIFNKKTGVMHGAMTYANADIAKHIVLTTLYPQKRVA